jgi:hypothetical protein
MGRMDVLAEDVKGIGFVCTAGSFYKPGGLRFPLGNGWDNAHPWLSDRVRAPIRQGRRPPQRLLDLRHHFPGRFDLVRDVQSSVGPTRVAR